MKLLREKVQIKEVGLPPSLDKTGLTNVWSFSKEISQFSKLRIGIIEFVGTETTSVQVGDCVLYNTIHTNAINTDNGVRLQAIEKNLVGVYDNYTINEKGLEMETIKFRPLDNRVVVKKLEKVAKKNVSGIVGPDKTDLYLKGVVVSITPFPLEKPLVVSVGDEILFSKSAGVEIDLEEGKFLIMREPEIYGIL